MHGLASHRVHSEVNVRVSEVRQSWSRAERHRRARQGERATMRFLEILAGAPEEDGWRGRHARRPVVKRAAG